MDNITFKTCLKRNSLFVYAKVLIPAIIFLGITGWIAVTKDLKFGFFTQDPIQTLNAKPYIGLISNVGIIFWAFTSAVLLFSAQLCRKQGKTNNISSFLFWAGILSLFLLFDDLLMFHETFSESIFFSIYFLGLAGIIYFHFRTILNSDYFLWLLAIMLLGSSVFIDLGTRFGLRLPHSSIFEDGFKFLGIIMWFSYFLRTSYKSVNNPAAS
jgi:hypothetical protein